MCVIEDSFKEKVRQEILDFLAGSGSFYGDQLLTLFPWRTPEIVSSVLDALVAEGIVFKTGSAIMERYSLLRPASAVNKQRAYVESTKLIPTLL